MVPCFTSGFQIRQGMKQNIIPAPTSKLSFKVQFFTETYFRIFKSFVKIAKIRFSRKFLVIRYEFKFHNCLNPGVWNCPVIPEPGILGFDTSIQKGVNSDVYPVAISQKVTKNLPVFFYSPTSGFKYILHILRSDMPFCQPLKDIVKPGFSWVDNISSGWQKGMSPCKKCNIYLSSCVSNSSCDILIPCVSFHHIW